MKFVVPKNLFDEICNNTSIILEKTGMNERDFKILLTLLEKYLKFIEKEVYAEKLLMAEDEMRNIDISDSPFLALSLTLNYK